VKPDGAVGIVSRGAYLASVVQPRNSRYGTAGLNSRYPVSADCPANKYELDPASY
jgi:hypothetical protein